LSSSNPLSNQFDGSSPVGSHNDRVTLYPERYRAASLNIKWTKVRAGMWSGLHSGLIYTIRQSGGAKFYITRAIERSHFASTRSLALAKATAQDDANDMLKAKDRSPPA
jgi:hypothetical protein